MKKQHQFSMPMWRIGPDGRKYWPESYKDYGFSKRRKMGDNEDKKPRSVLR